MKLPIIGLILLCLTISSCNSQSNVKDIKQITGKWKLIEVVSANDGTEFDQEKINQANTSYKFETMNWYYDIRADHTLTYNFYFYPNFNTPAEAIWEMDEEGVITSDVAPEEGTPQNDEFLAKFSLVKEGGKSYFHFINDKGYLRIRVEKE